MAESVHENPFECVAGVSPARGGGILPPQDGCFPCISAAGTAAALAGKMPATRFHTRSEIRRLLPAAAAFLLAAMAAAAFGAARAPESIDARLEAAATQNQSRNRAREDLALATCREILAEPKATVRQKMAAFDIAVEILRRRKDFEEALKTAEGVRTALATDKEAEARAFLVQVDLYKEWGRKDDAVAKAREFVERHGDNKPACAAAQVKLAAMLLDMKKYRECGEEATKAIEWDGANEVRVTVALRLVSDAAWQDNDMERCLTALGRLLEPKYMRELEPWNQVNCIYRYADCLRRLKRFDEVRAHFAKYEKEDPDPARAQRWCLSVAQSFGEENRWDEAIAAYERVFTAHPDVSENWYTAQWNIANALASKDRLEDAIRAYRICLDSGADNSTITACVKQIADLFKKADNNVTRANELINFQRFGPAGEDGQSGTDDDLSNPLDALGYPQYPQRERAFAEARRRAGDDEAASRQRALTCIYSGHPKEALRLFADAAGRHAGGEFQKLAKEMIAVGVRSARGHAAGLDAVYRFVAYGPLGPDGKPNTDDDLADPIAPLIGTAPATGQARELPDGNGGAAELSPEDIKLLREARELLERFATDEHEPARARHDALAALLRVHEALDDWGAPGQLDWYLNLLMTGTSSELYSALEVGGEAAAKARDYHLGGVHEYWRKVDALPAERKKPSPRETDRVRAAFEKTVTDILRGGITVHSLKPLPVPVSKPVVTTRPKPTPATTRPRGK